ncbi:MULTISPECIES: hypothetical protein [Gordonibacter]|uniref:Uncharacterized protein n=1 Tax=Gordonibacter faecis TaxID=3047475 RepID=A0ABT7DQ09_9ACTN|nr:MULTISPECIES: hypothetical protein [unclassified Gordonibacter]MDJ1651640.1 hypothetical protein [Gordonibacter sp. KGMB12511]HIW77063.1 hypothetical protein [Candidatus Gordonibacter avicola]
MAVSIGKGEFKAYMCSVIDGMEEGSEQYRRFSELFLTACGVIDTDGNLTDEYKCSPYWAGGDDGTPLRPSVQSELLSKLSPRVREAVVSMETEHGR